MKTNDHSLSVIILMFNEEPNIDDALNETVDFLESAVADWEIIVVDDGSTDSSAEIVSRKMAYNSKIKLTKHKINMGMGAAMATGVRAATKDFFIFNAADGQVPAREIGKMLPLLDDSNIVLTKYEGGRENKRRGLLSQGFRLYMRAVAGISFEMEGLYIFPTDVAKDLLNVITAQTFFFSFELIQRGTQRRLTTSSTSIICKPRRHGHSKVTGLSRISRVALEALLFGIKKRIGR